MVFFLSILKQLMLKNSYQKDSLKKLIYLTTFSLTPINFLPFPAHESHGLARL